MKEEPSVPEEMSRSTTADSLSPDLTSAPKCDSQYRDEIQNDDGPCSETDWTCPREEGCDKKIREKYLLSESDSKELKYVYHRGSDCYNEVGTTDCNNYGHQGNTISHSFVDENCKIVRNIQPVDHDNKYIHCHENKQLNCNDTNCTADQDHTRFVVYSDEQVYHGTEREILTDEPPSETNYEYLSKNENIHNDKADMYPRSQSVIQRGSPTVVNQESCRENNYSYLKDNANTYQTEDMSHVNNETCIVREYVYPGSDHVYQEGPNYDNKRNPCQDRFYSYEEVYQGEAASSMAKPLSQEQCHDYQHDESKFYYRDEGATLKPESFQNNYSYTQDNRQCFDKTSIAGEAPFHIMKFQDTNVFPKSESSLVEEENGCVYKDDDTRQRDETSAVDLRISRDLSYTTSTGESDSYYNKIDEPSNDSQLSNSFYTTGNPEENPTLVQPTFSKENSSSKPSYIIPDQMRYEEEYKNSTQLPQLKELLNCTRDEASGMEGHNLWDVATNTEPTLAEEKESQTELKEMKDVAVQTETKHRVLPFAFLKNIQEEISKHTCPICQRVYISKSSLDRHLKTHEKDKSNNAIANVRFTTEAKLQICKRAGKPKHLKASKPIIIQVPRSFYQCDMCEKGFLNQMEKDNHDCVCKPFPMTKCPECHIKFYTTGALNEHLGIVHKKENAYYCIFCNKSFNAGYNFHLHLDEHLSTQ